MRSIMDEFVNEIIEHNLEKSRLKFILNITGDIKNER